eukprot:1433720-Rhodomonas_salina.3
MFASLAASRPPSLCFLLLFLSSLVLYDSAQAPSLPLNVPLFRRAARSQLSSLARSAVENLQEGTQVRGGGGGRAGGGDGRGESSIPGTTRIGIPTEFSS